MEGGEEHGGKDTLIGQCCREQLEKMAKEEDERC